MKVAIIGGGIAGCAIAYVLKHSGVSPVIYERGSELATGASGHARGLYNPRFSAERMPQSDYFISAYALARSTFELITNNGGDIGWNPCGALHLMNDEKKQKRFPQTLANWNWEREHMQMLNAQAASAVAGVDVGYDALYLPDAGYVSPKKLCDFYAKDVAIEYGVQVSDLNAFKAESQADVVVLACAYGANEFFSWLKLGQVRGQVTEVQSTEESEKLACNLCYGGYATPAQDGVHMLGATFQRWLSHSDPLSEDDRDNFERLRQIMPSVGEKMKIVGHRAALRTTSKDHFPIVGRLPEMDDFYISTAHGSHGILSSLMSAHILGDMIVRRPISVGRDVVEALSPARFL